MRAMVWVCALRAISAGMGSLVAIEHALDLPCWRMERMLLTSQYSTSPAGKKKKRCEYVGHVLLTLCLHRIGRHRIQLCLDHHGEGHQDRQHVIRFQRATVLDPQDERRVTPAQSPPEHPIQRDEYRDLHQDREAATQGIDLLGLRSIIAWFILARCCRTSPDLGQPRRNQLHLGHRLVACR